MLTQSGGNINCQVLVDQVRGVYRVQRLAVHCDHQTREGLQLLPQRIGKPHPPRGGMAAEVNAVGLIKAEFELPPIVRSRFDEPYCAYFGNHPSSWRVWLSD